MGGVENYLIKDTASRHEANNNNASRLNNMRGNVISYVKQNDLYLFRIKINSLILLIFQVQIN